MGHLGNPGHPDVQAAIQNAAAVLDGAADHPPGGKKQMHPNNQHTLKPVYIGEILEDGQFKIVTKLRGLVSPDSYSSYLHPDGNYPAPTGGSKK